MLFELDWLGLVRLGYLYELDQVGYNSLVWLY